MAYVGGNCKEALYFCFIVCHAYFFLLVVTSLFQLFYIYIYFLQQHNDAIKSSARSLLCPKQRREKKGN